MKEYENEAEIKAMVLLNRMNSPYPIGQALREGISPSELLGQIEYGNRFERSEPLQKVRAQLDPDRELEQCRQLGIRLVTCFDPDYPLPLHYLYDPPLLLYRKGEWMPEDSSSMAIVGTRRPNFYGIEQTRRFAKELAESGLTVISGFAKGVDQISHENALRISYGRTVAVLGCGLDQDYPRGSRKLYDEISERGALFSEYPLGTLPFSGNFPKRNRIIAGLSLGVLVVQANLRSGSLITAHQAVEQGKEVFAVPGPIDSIAGQGTHLLIKEGAFLVESAAEILEILSMSVPKLSPAGMEFRTERKSHPKEEDLPFMKQDEGLPDLEKKLLQILNDRPQTMEELLLQCGDLPAPLSGALLSLELKKRIVKTPDQRYTAMDLKKIKVT